MKEPHEKTPQREMVEADYLVAVGQDVQALVDRINAKLEKIGPAASVEPMLQDLNELAWLGVKVKAIGEEIRARNQGGRPKMPESEYGQLARDFEKFKERTGDCSLEAYRRDVAKRNRALEAGGFEPLFALRLTTERSWQNAIERGKKRLAALRGAAAPP
jgi:hypothetical protein